MNNIDFLLDTVAGGMVVKIGAESELAAEAWALDRARSRDVVVPVVVARTAKAPGLPGAVLVLRRLSGGPVTENSETQLAEAGRQLRRVHEVGLSGFGGLAESGLTLRRDVAAPVGPYATWTEALLAPLDGLTELTRAGVLDRGLVVRLGRGLSERCAVLDLDGPGMLLHNDLKLDHLFADDRELTGIIDWGDAAVGDPRFDLARLSMAGDRVMTAFLSGYGWVPSAADEPVLTLYRVLWNLDALLYEFRAGGDWFAVYRQRIQEGLDELGL